MTWMPGRAQQRLELETPFTDVPPHLATPLIRWLSEALNRCDASEIIQFAIEHRLSVPMTYFENPAPFIVTRCANDAGLHLDMIEAMLEYDPSPQLEEEGDVDDEEDDDALDYQGIDAAFGFHRVVPWATLKRARLDEILENGNSAYRVNSAGDGLELRLSAGIVETVSKAIDSSSGSAGDHLTSAWNATYGRTPDPSKAYNEAVKAVECALAPIVAPKDKLTTLGKMITSIKDKPEKWTLAGSASGVETILAMMKTLWNGQTSRHGGSGATRKETQEEAVMALHFAATLVQLGSDGEFRSV